LRNGGIGEKGKGSSYLCETCLTEDLQGPKYAGQNGATSRESSSCVTKPYRGERSTGETVGREVIESCRVSGLRDSGTPWKNGQMK